MSPTELAEYIDVLKKAGVASARVILGANEINVIFGPDPLPEGSDITPGGWKGPERLDDHSTFDVPLSEVSP